MAMRMQAIEFKTSRLAEIQALIRARRGRVAGAVIHGTVTARRDRPGTYLTIVESAFDLSLVGGGSRHPEVSDLVAELAVLCDGPLEVYDLALGSIPEPRAPVEVGRMAGSAPGWLS
jgi:hypothetical protein